VSIPIVCIFGRAPVLGRVKSRLAAEIGDQAALEAHRELAEATLARLAAIEGVVTELWLDDVDDPAGRAWAQRWHLPLRQQQGDDLGERMHRALLCCLASGAPGIVVGTDCPAIDAAYVGRAVAALQNHDAVVGPAADGGYGLVGIRRAVPEMFQGITWGSSSVLSATLDAAASVGVSVARLPEIEDVDTAADWRRYVATRVAAQPGVSRTGGPGTWSG
jgi:hypothetical protein